MTKQTLTVVGSSNARVVLLNIDDFPAEVAGRVIARFKAEWPGMVKRVKEGKRVNRPRIDSRVLYEKLKEYMTSSRMSEDELWGQIIVSNRMRGLWTHKKFKCTVNTLKKAREAGFYLGMDPDFSWLDQIY